MKMKIFLIYLIFSTSQAFSLRNLSNFEKEKLMKDMKKDENNN